MKLNKRTGFFVIGAILLLCSLVLFYYSMFVSHMASYNVHRELQQIYASNQAATSLTLSNEKFKELMQWAQEDEKRWRFQLGSSVKLLFYSAIVLLLMAIIQIALTRHIYKHSRAVPLEPGDADLAVASLRFYYENYLNNRSGFLLWIGYMGYLWVASAREIDRVCGQIQAGQNIQEVKDRIQAGKYLLHIEYKSELNVVLWISIYSRECHAKFSC